MQTGRYRDENARELVGEREKREKDIEEKRSRYRNGEKHQGRHTETLPEAIKNEALIS